MNWTPAWSGRKAGAGLEAGILLIQETTNLGSDNSDCKTSGALIICPSCL